ncbi:MAG: Glycosyl transferase, group 1 [candidate division WWE3 bacterium GW2011_GWA2_46_9]|uniref:Glycosyl transferase, group 1 n=1 Tax=candidate division WWE3 bacterium GW2011_GWA2_46_9 TaxID=1619111 RepID=A0A0G1QVV2_UNCKA|nr:MAG: Glycosyl transferase, group 1 [candidate division WWE3 bacterium GW2011_GWA2_46_9]
MVIGLNGQGLLAQNPAGPERYTYELYKALAQIDKENRYTILFEKQPPKQYIADLCQHNPNFSYKVLPKFISWTQVSLALYLVFNKTDVFFTPIHTLPIAALPYINAVSTIHGLEYAYAKNPIFIGQHEWFVAAFSKKVIVPSNAVKEALVKKKWPFVDDAKMEVIPEGVGKMFYKQSVAEINIVRNKYKLGNEPYLLFVSTINPRKNLPNTIAGFSMANLENARLVVSGAGGQNWKEAYEAAKKYNVADRVKFIGMASDTDLPALYSGAKVFVSCSLDEGFGLPLLEAMACETRVVASDIPAYKELGLDLITYVNPNSKESIKDGILKSVDEPANEALRDRPRDSLFDAFSEPNNSNALKIRAAEFSWEQTARKTLAAFQNSVKNG